MDSTKRHKDMTLEDEPLRLEGVPLLRKSRGQLLIAPERKKRLSQQQGTMLGTMLSCGCI